MLRGHLPHFHAQWWSFPLVTIVTAFTMSASAFRIFLYFISIPVLFWRILFFFVLFCLLCSNSASSLRSDWGNFSEPLGARTDRNVNLCGEARLLCVTCSIKAEHINRSHSDSAAPFNSMKPNLISNRIALHRSKLQTRYQPHKHTFIRIHDYCLRIHEHVDKILSHM